MAVLFKIAQFLFADGCTFLAPYALVFGVAWTLDASNALVHNIYLLLHVVNLALLAIFVIKSDRFKIRNYSVILAGTFLVIYINGIYMEYPSDTWEYFKNIFYYNSIPNLRVPAENARFTYFFSWTLIDWVSFESRREALRFIASFWATLLLLQTYFLMRRLGDNPTRSIIQTVAVLLFLGYSNVSYFRYLGLSSTLICFAFYFRVLIILIQMLEQKRLRPLVYHLPLLLIGIAFSHSQGFLFLAVSVLALALYKLLDHKNVFRKKLTKAEHLKFVLLTNFLVLFGWFNMILRQIGLRLTTFTIGDLQKVLNASDIYSSTVGWHGVINACLALVFLFSYPLPAILTLMPVFLIIFPPTLKLIRDILPYSIVSHRVLYALPACYFLTVGAEYLVTRFAPKAKKIQPVLVIVVLMIFAWPANGPWFGRLKHLIVHEPVQTELLHLEPLGAWLQANRKPSKTNCHYLSDRITMNFIATHFAAEPDTGRANQIAWAPHIKSNPELAFNGEYCGVLLARKELIPIPVTSETNQILGHWPDNSTDIAALYDDEMTNKIKTLANQKNWQMTPVPPFYELYEPRQP